MSRQATVSHPLCARLYAKQAEVAESRGVADQRRRMLAGLVGEIVEVAVPVQVGNAVAEDLPLADASVDAAVASLVLCSVRNPAQAIAELHRVVRPGGEIRFNEHIASERPLGRALQRTADATIWPTVSGGCHLGRDTRTALEHGGFRIERVEQFVFSVSALDPPKTHILGTARRV
jgi:ubiquinone/menaquinone biosynthesis C-methylase UbiE